MSDGYRLASQEIARVLQPSNAQRVEYFVHKVADWEEVWSLRTDAGWVLLGTDEGRQAAPFWPFEAFAKECAVSVWTDARPERMDLDAFIGRWLPGLARDERLVTVFPDQNGTSSTIAPLDLLARIEHERSRILEDQAHGTVRLPLPSWTSHLGFTCTSAWPPRPTSMRCGRFSSPSSPRRTRCRSRTDSERRPFAATGSRRRHRTWPWPKAGSSACTRWARTTPTSAHVASATYVVDPASQGHGIGRALVEHSLAQAQSAGFLAMQFNYVVSTNLPAVALYRKLGFAIVGTLPKAFRHRDLGLVDVYVMHRFL